MRTRALVLIALAVTAVAVTAPLLQKPPQLTGQMADAQFLVGTWEGEGWMMTPEGRHEATVREVITPKAGGTVLSLEGLGKDKKTGEVVHDAFGVLFFDPQTKAHRMRSFLATGTGGEFPATVKKGEIVWNMTAGPREIRFTIRLDDQGRWHEIGEVQVNGQWMKMFEMTLKKVS
jgi:hypothetical protein